MPCARASTNSVVSHYSCASISLPLLYWGGQNWAQHSKCGLTCAKQRGRIASLGLLATLLLTQLRMLMGFFAARSHLWLMVTGCPLGTLRPFLQTCFLDSQPQPVWLHGVTPFQVQDFAFAIVELHEVTVKIPLSGRPTSQHSNCSSQFHTICKPYKGALII